MNASLPGGKPLLVGAVLVAAAWYWMRSRAVAAPVRAGVAGRPVGQPYATPTTVAEQLASGVVRTLYGIVTAPPQGISVGTVQARDQLRAAERASDPSYYGWSGPSASPVSPPVTGFGNQVDTSPTAPVYDIGTDYARDGGPRIASWENWEGW